MRAALALPGPALQTAPSSLVGGSIPRRSGRSGSPSSTRPSLGAGQPSRARAGSGENSDPQLIKLNSINN